MNQVGWMKGSCNIWSSRRLISSSLPVGDDWYLNLSSQKRLPARNLGQHRYFHCKGRHTNGITIKHNFFFTFFPKSNIIALVIHISPRPSTFPTSTSNLAREVSSSRSNGLKSLNSAKALFSFHYFPYPFMPYVQCMLSASSSTLA